MATLYIFAGLPGTGKTALSRRLSGKTRAVHLRLGLSVVADSCNPIELTRREWEQVAMKSGSRFVNIEVLCSESESCDALMSELEA